MVHSGNGRTDASSTQTVRFRAANYTATEGGSDVTVTVTIAPPAATLVTIPLTKTHIRGATAPDYTGIPANLTFNAGQTSRTFTDCGENLPPRM